MDNKQKQRIVGIVFLVILAVVAIPALLKHAGNPTQPVSTTTDNLSPAAQTVGNAETPPVEGASASTDGSVASEQPAMDQGAGAAGQPNIPEQAGSATAPTPPLGEESPGAGALQQMAPGPEQALPGQAVPAQAPLNAQPLSAPQAESSVMQEPAGADVDVGPAPTTVQPISPSSGVATTTAAKPQPVGAESKKSHQKLDHGVKSDWTIRLAVFSVQSNAQKLINSMKKQGHKGYIEAINTYKGMTYRVLLKTHSSKAEADRLVEKLNKLFHVSAIVGRHP